MNRHYGWLNNDHFIPFANISLSFVFALLCPILAMANDAPEPLKNRHHGDIYHQPACESGELVRLKKLINELSEGGADKSWQLVKTFLCGEGEEAERYVVNHMPNTIASSSYDWESGKEIVEEIQKSANIMRRKKAWEANALTIGASIRVFFMPNTYCVMSFDIAPKNTDWYIVGLGSACE